MSKRFFFALPGIVLAAVISLLPVLPARAQAQAYLLIAPEQITLPADGSSATLEVHIQDADQVYGFDVRFSFDPDVIEMQEIRLGEFVDPGFVLVNAVDNVNGTAQYAMTQLNPSPARDGSGVLLRLILRGINTGGSPVAFTAVQLARRDGSVQPSGWQNGWVDVALNAPTITPTFTATRTLTPTSTASHTPTRTLTRTLTSTLTRTVTPTTTLTLATAAFATQPPPVEEPTAVAPPPDESMVNTPVPDGSATHPADATVQPTQPPPGPGATLVPAATALPTGQTRPPLLRDAQATLWYVLLAALAGGGLYFAVGIARNLGRKS